MRFKGDIIITDPCYICKEKELVGEYPKRDDYFIYGTDIEKYPDAVREVIDISKECSEMVKVLEQLDKALGHTDPEYRKKHPRTHFLSKIYEECNKKYKEALDEYYELNEDDWEKSNLGENMEVLGINTYISRDTLYGDWSCTTYNSDTKEKLGEFCADVGGVAVFLLDEVLKYNPDYDDHIAKPWTTTLIKDFDGEVNFEIIHDEVSVIGKGNINFETHQTGFYEKIRTNSYFVDKWVAFRQKGMRPVLHGKVRKVDDSGLCMIRGKRAKIRFANVDKIIGIYDKKSDCYKIK